MGSLNALNLDTKKRKTKNFKDSSTKAAAKKLSINTISFVGFQGGHAKSLSDHSIHINVNNYGIVEDIHHSLMHMLSQYIRVINLEEGKDIEQIVI